MNSTKWDFKIGDLVICLRTRTVWKIQQLHQSDEPKIFWAVVSHPHKKIKPSYVRYTDHTSDDNSHYVKFYEELIPATKLAKLLYSEGDCL